MKNESILLIAALSLILASCDNDNGLENNALSGKDVPVRIRSMSVAEGNSGNLTRSASQKEQEMVPIGDGMLLEMSITQDELRADPELPNGTLFRVIAVTGTSNNYYSHGDYTYGSGTLTPSPSTDFHVKVGQAYSFICISYNSTTTLPSANYTVGSALPTSFSVNNSYDLLWWRSSGSTTIAASGIDLDITLEQKLSKVSVILDCTYNSWNILAAADKVSIEAIGGATMNWTTGAITGSNTTPFFSFQTRSTPDSPTHTSNVLRILPRTSNAVITLAPGSVTRESPLIALPVTASSHTLDQALVAGVNYTIRIRLRTPIIARSNIYWNGSAMDFVRAGTDGSKEGYQGLYFKWGSLVGISPITTPWSGSIPCYWPNSSSIQYYGSWGSIPYENDGNATQTGAPNTTTLKGDICTQIDPLYRLPKVGEFGTVFGYGNHGWTVEVSFTTVTIPDTYTDGTYDFIANNKGLTKNEVLGIRIPASGNRLETDGRLGNASQGDQTGYNGVCWMNPADDPWNSYCISLTYNNAYVAGVWQRAAGFSVRCAKN